MTNDIPFIYGMIRFGWVLVCPQRVRYDSPPKGSIPIISAFTFLSFLPLRNIEFIGEIHRNIR